MTDVTPRETRASRSDRSSKPVKKISISNTNRRPRRWQRKWVKVGHLSLLKWVAGLLNFYFPPHPFANWNLFFKLIEKRDVHPQIIFNSNSFFY